MHKNSLLLVPEHLTRTRRRYEGAHGIAWHVRARLRRHARLAAHAVHGPTQPSQAAEGCDSTLRVSTARLKSGPESCMHGTVSQLQANAVQPDRLTRAAPEHLRDQLVRGDRLNVRSFVPTKYLEQEPPPAHTRAIHRQRTQSAPGWAPQDRSVGKFALRTTCR